MENNDVQNELFGMTQAWSRYNDYLYILTNQLLSLTYAHKYFGTEESGSVLKEIFDNLCTEIEALKNFENNNKDKGIKYIESRDNFNFDKISKIITEILNNTSGKRSESLKRLGRRSSADSEDLQIEELKSTFSDQCPISRSTIIQPLTQKYCNDNNTCEHIFERSNLLQFLNKKDSITCPVIGCKKNIYKAYLHKDLELDYFKKKQKFHKHIENITSKPLFF
ncbi:Zinc-finger of the MIZ type in Nse subunit family protein [Theileria parva strain Muguga]|uniref:Zinc-finger of the MIZ type in Nse subunit family protein n=1 Tax=Theileria parva strain Muguga TaxID=333668 RepID=UPI001C6221FD|nr:Zinc-finger of the MIZ type in Nse subunit family protein [Theileria parva strain Muguga]EAN33765.2 Zinc-finger of the MIZ type in Nse subunit family protein [Theileria parva strain Muguga]